MIDWTISLVLLKETYFGRVVCELDQLTQERIIGKCVQYANFGILEKCTPKVYGFY